MNVLDTSVLYALYDEDHAHHGDAMELLSRPMALALPRGVLQETLDLIRYRHGKDAAVRAADHLLGLPHVAVVEDAPHVDVVGVWRRHGDLSFADAGAVMAAWAMGAQVVTFDGPQGKVAEHGPP